VLDESGREGGGVGADVVEGERLFRGRVGEALDFIVRETGDNRVFGIEDPLPGGEIARYW